MPTANAVTFVPYEQDPLAVLAAALIEEHRAPLPLLEHVVVLLPDMEAAPRLRRLLLEQAQQAGHTALLGPRILRLADWLKHVPLPEQRIISDHGRELMLVEALREHRQLFGHGNLWSLADSLLQLFDELTLNKIGLPTSLEEFRQRLITAYGADSQSLQALTLEARVVHTLWQAWHEQMQQRGVIDQASAYLLRLAASAKRIGSPLYLAGFSRFSRAEMEWLQPLLATKKLRLLLQGEPDDAITRQLLEPYGHELSTPDTTQTTFGQLLNTALQPTAVPLARRAADFAIRHTASPALDRCWIYNADGAEEEAQAVDLQVRRWLLQGVERIAIVTENRRLARRVRALLERAAIELRDSAGWALSTTSAAAVVERWLQCVEEDFPHQAMLDLLKSPFLFDAAERGQRLADVYRLEQGIVLQGNIGRSLQRYRRQLELRSSLLPPELAAELERVGQLLDLLEQAAVPLQPYTDGQHRPDQLISALLESLQCLGLFTRLGDDAAGSRLLEELNAMAQAVTPDTLPLSWVEFRTWFGRTLERFNFRPPVSGGQVQLMGLEQSCLGRFDGLIIAGAEREYFPGAPQASPFFNEAVRRQLELPTAEQQREERFQHFRRLLESAPRVLITLRRRQDDEDVLPSPWVEALQAFHRLAYQRDLDDPILAAWLQHPDSQVFRCDTTELPPAACQPRPSLPQELLPKTLSASAYQQLVDCPYQFYAARGLGLAPPEAIREALEKADYGARVHRSLEAFHSGLPALPGPFGKVLTATNRNEAIELLEGIARRVFAADLKDNFLHRDWLQRWLACIPAYIDWQVGREQAQWRVTQAEQELRCEEFLPGLALKGRVDRIDAGPEGTAIVDYKTGGIPTLAEVEQGEAVQLPFYALLTAEGAQQVEYLVLDKGTASSKGTLEGEALSALAAANAQRLRELFTDLHAAHPLPAWGDPATCQYCDMTGICRRSLWENSNAAP